MVSHGFYDFLNWFDERAWYPLGRIVGGTVSGVEGSGGVLSVLSVLGVMGVIVCVLSVGVGVCGVMSRQNDLYQVLYWYSFYSQTTSFVLVQMNIIK